MTETRKVKPMGKRSILITAVIFATIAALLPTIPTEAAGDAQIRVIHASPDTPPVDVYVDGARVISALGFTKSSDYQTIAAGKHDFQLYQGGAIPATSDPVIQAKGMEIPAGAKLSLVGIGWLASIRTLVVDDRTPAPTPGKAKLRFVHVGPDVQPVDFATKGGAVLSANSQFGNAYPYQEVDTQRSEIEIRPAGTATGVVAVGFAPESGKTYSVYLMSLGAMKVLLDTTASDATIATNPATSPSAGTNPATTATNGAATAPAGGANPTANAAVATSPRVGAAPPFLGMTGRMSPRRPFDAKLLLIGLAGVACIVGGTAVRRRVSC